MNEKIIKAIIRHSLISISFFLFIIICGLLIIGYDTCFSYLIGTINLPANKHVDLNKLLHFDRKIAIWSILICIFILTISALYFKNIIYKLISQLILYIRQTFKNVFSDIYSIRGLCILAIPFILSIYLGLTVPVSYDEAYTYITFVSKPFYYSATFYPSPNNHILYSILANIAEIIPFFSELFCLRIPTIFISLLAWIIAYSFVKRNFSENLAILIVGIASVLFMFIYYSFIARGYSLSVLFFIICFYSAYNIIKKGSKTKDWAFFTVSSILGIYTIPSFIYPLVSLNVLILVFNYRNIKQQILYNSAACIITLILYSPIMILQQGIETISNNRFVAPVDRMTVIDTLPSFFEKTIFHISPIIVLVIVGIAFLVACFNKDKWLISTWIIFLISPFILLTLHSVIPFPRTFLYYGFTITFLITASFQIYINKLKTKYIFIGVIIIQIISSIHFVQNISTHESYNTTAKELNDFVLKEKNKKYYLANSICNINFEYEYLIRGYNPTNVVYDDNSSISADSISGYDYIIINEFDDSTKYKLPIYENFYQVVYSGK